MSTQSLSQNPSWANMKEKEAQRPFSFIELGKCVNRRGISFWEQYGSGRGCAASAAVRWSNLGFGIGSSTFKLSLLARVIERLEQLRSVIMCYAT